MSSAAPTIDAAGLEKHYGRTRAVDGLSLTVGAGEIFGLLGPNGAGKTTTVEIIEGYRRPDAGTVRVMGLDPIADGGRLRPRIGVMLQDGGVYPGARPLEILELFASFYENPEDPEDLLRLVGLADARQTTVRRLSGGQRQRLSLALALVGAPSLVFLDEPTAGMDVHARTLTWQLVRDFRARGMTVVLTTHAMDEAEQLCDRIAIIDAGRVIACGTPAELTRESGQLTFSAEPGLATEELAAALGLSVSAVSETSPGRYVVTRAPTPELVAEIAIWLRDRGVTIGELRAGRRSLEEVFLRLTGAERS